MACLEAGPPPGHVAAGYDEQSSQIFGNYLAGAIMAYPGRGMERPAVAIAFPDS
jgi:hypothetical protein